MLNCDIFSSNFFWNQYVVDFFFQYRKKKWNAQIFKVKRNARGLLETNLFFFLALRFHKQFFDKMECWVQCRAQSGNWFIASYCRMGLSLEKSLLQLVSNRKITRVKDFKIVYFHSFYTGQGFTGSCRMCFQGENSTNNCSKFTFTVFSCCLWSYVSWFEY